MYENPKAGLALGPLLPTSRLIPPFFLPAFARSLARSRLIRVRSVPTGVRLRPPAPVRAARLGRTQWAAAAAPAGKPDTMRRVDTATELGGK